MVQRSVLIIVFMLLNIHGYSQVEKNLDHAVETLQRIFKLYNAGRDNLFLETYPFKSDEKATYLASEDTIREDRVAYLWPTSGVFSAVNALLKTTEEQEYLALLENKILPGLSNYYDTTRTPVCYQSYITGVGESDRFYDDNIWLAIDFLDTYEITGNPDYLTKSETLWQFIQSGYDEKLGGGIYWCEQKRKTKNTCSNAPAAVLALQLFLATNDSNYLDWGTGIYEWTKQNLQDPADHLYFDNVNLKGKVDQRKYTYNSGQMLQAAGLLYQITGKEQYLKEARQIAVSAIDHFTKAFVNQDGKSIRLFRNTGNWFNAVLLRGYMQLYKVDKNPEFLYIFQENMDYLWHAVRNKDGLFSKDWSGEKEDQYKWLLDQASLVEIWANLARRE